ncbi:MAG: hypothetical protein JW955_12380 [Sedimentisphaerales bacterium]|nr:hypothetical protein [Sedimentisphaerales bacterium]
MGVFIVCALAAQQQGEPADQAVEVKANCARVSHNHYNYTYRPRECKTFLARFPFGPFTDRLGDPAVIRPVTAVWRFGWTGCVQVRARLERSDAVESAHVWDVFTHTLKPAWALTDIHEAYDTCGEEERIMPSQQNAVLEHRSTKVIDMVQDCIANTKGVEIAHSREHPHRPQAGVPANDLPIG